jgi:hypothetical protein
MGGANTGTNKIGEAQFAAGTVPKATKATAADLAAFDAQQAQNKRIGQGLGALAQGISDIDFSSPASAALTSQNQSEMYKKYLEMQKQLEMNEKLKNNPDALNFMVMNPFEIHSTNPELISNAWANAGKTLATSALSGVGKMYGM